MRVEGGPAPPRPFRIPATGSPSSRNCTTPAPDRSPSRSTSPTLDQLVVGAEVFIDDGKARPASSKDAGGAEIEVYAAREKGVRLKPGKGVNFPRPSSNCRR